MMNKGTKILTGIALLCCSAFINVGYASITKNLAIFGNLYGFTQSGLFITKVTPVGESNNSLINNFVQTALDSSIILTNDITSSITYEVEFYNGFDISQYYFNTSYLDETVYDNQNITYQIDAEVNPMTNRYSIPAKSYGKLNITFSYIENANTSENTLNSTLNFVFKDVVSETFVIEGNTADNEASITDGSTNYDGSNTNYRWTSWSSNDDDRGLPSTMYVVPGNEFTFDSVKVYHFIDHKGCALPTSMELSYFDETTNSYILLAEGEDYTISTNFTGVSRNYQGIYQMYLNGSNQLTTFTHSYKGNPPITTFNLDSEITTKGIRIKFNADPDYFIGLMELEVYHGSDNVLK